MNVAELFVKRWEAEQPAFAKVLRAIPGNRLDYRPHERSTSAGELAWQLAEEQRALAEMFDSRKVDWNLAARPATLAEITDAWDRATVGLRSGLSKLDEEAYDAEVPFFANGTPAGKDTVGNMLWGFLFDMVHHRGQLSSYLRPMGGKVPAIYGPSGDDSGA